MFCKGSWSCPSCPSLVIPRAVVIAHIWLYRVSKQLPCFWPLHHFQFSSLIPLPLLPVPEERNCFAEWTILPCKAILIMPLPGSDQPLFLMRATPRAASDKQLVWTCPSWHAIFLIIYIISLLWKFSLGKVPLHPCWCSENRDHRLCINSKNSENEHSCSSTSSSAVPIQSLLLKNILFWHAWILSRYFKFESFSSQVGCHRWLAGKSVVLWSSVVTRGGKVQFVSIGS